MQRAMAAFSHRLRALLAPESTIIRLAELSTRAKLILFGVIGGGYWATGPFLDGPGLDMWRVSGVFVPVAAVLLWGGLVGLAIFWLQIPGNYLLVNLQGHVFTGGPGGPIIGTIILLLFGMLRRYILQYAQAREEIRTLEGIIPICAACKKIRDDEGFWHRVEEYVSHHTTATFSHGLCPDCFAKTMAEFETQQEFDDLRQPPIGA